MDVIASYRILELEIGASRAAVDTAYCRLLELWHPDRAAAGGPESAREAQRMIQAINDAYQMLAKIAPGAAPASPPPGAAPAARPGPAATLPPSVASAAPTKPRLSPLPAGQSTLGRLPPPPTPPPPGTWAARSASEAGAPTPPTPVSPPASPTPPLPTKSLPPLPAPLTSAPVASAPLPAPLPGDLSRAGDATDPGLPATGNGPTGTELPAALAPETAPVPPPLFPDLRSQTTAVYEKLFPVDSPRRRFGPLVVAAALLFFLLLGKCAYSSLSRKSSGPPDPKTVGRLIIKSNVADATIEAERIIRPGDHADPNIEGVVDQPLSDLKPGKYSVTVRAAGWADTRGEVTVDAAHTTETAMNFKSGSLRLDSIPSGATVRLGAAVLGRTPLVAPHLPPGAHQLALEYPSWPVATFKTTITESVETTVTVRLPHGKVTVETIPPGVAVLLAGRALGSTPLTLEPFPAGTRKLTLQAKNFPPLEVSVTVEDRGDVKVRPILGSVFPVLDPAALLRAVWIRDDSDSIAPPLEGVTGPFQSQNGIVKNLNRKRLFENWLRKRYCLTAIVKSYDRASGQIEFSEQKNEFSSYRVLATLSAEARTDPDLPAQLTKGSQFALYGRLTAVEEPRWLSKVITFELSSAEPLR